MPRRPITPRDLWDMRRVGAPAPAPDGSFVVVPVTSYDVEANEGKERLFRVGGGAVTPLTAADVSSSQPAVSPDGRAVAFVRKPPPPKADAPKPPGWDKPQPFVLPLAGGEAQRPGDAPVLFPLGASDPRWFPDGKRLCVVAPVLSADKTLEGTRRILEQRAKDPVVAHVTEDRLYRFWDQWLTDGAVPHLFEIDVATGAVRDLTPDSDRWFDFMEDSGQYDISPDGTEIVFSANVSRSPHARVRWAIWAVPVGGGPIVCITPDGKADEARPRYSPDGRFVVYGARITPDVYCDRVRLARYDRAAGTNLVLTEAWDRAAAEWEFTDATTLAILAEDRGRVSLFRMDVSQPGVPELCVHDGTLHGLRAAPGGAAAVLATHCSLRHPPELVRSLLVPGAGVERLTHFNDALLAEVELGHVEEIVFVGAEDEPCQMFVVWPPERASSPERRWPLLHLIHGGPYGAFGDTWHFRWNSMVLGAPGYVVAMVNFHGSASFGEAWARSILEDWGGKPATDILRGTDALLATGAIDPDRMAISGGSFGGYMTCWLASQTSRFRCAIAHAAVFDLPVMYAGDITQGFLEEFGAEPWGGPEARTTLDRWNPAAFAAGYSTPMLVLHGEKDYRVPATQALQLYGILKARGIEARLVYYPDENHWILKPRNSLHWYNEFHTWLDRWLKK